MAAEALLEHLIRGVPQPIWVQYAQALLLAGYSIGRHQGCVRPAWLITIPDASSCYVVARRQDGLWGAVPLGTGQQCDADP